VLFNSYGFIFKFFPVVLIGYFMLNQYGKNQLAKGWLVLASLYFYAYLNHSYLIIIITSIVINYSLGNWLHSESKSDFQRKLILTLGVIFNVGMLGYFKYYDFFIGNMNVLFRTDISLLNLMLPLGISFFTFQQLSFVIDSYQRKNLKYDFLSYCLFVTFFPQLIAGPIVLPNEMLPQFEDKKNKFVNYENLNKGSYLFSIGLAKKVLLADIIAPFADTGFDKMTSLTFIEGWLTSVSYTMQLYFDFSGYCDMAMGIALMFNIILPLNFNSPYKATNIQDFWNRWHMTLGRFLTNYLYIPLGGNRKGGIKTLKNLMIVFLVSGLWHGAGWTFIIWGGLHGIAILIHRLWKQSGRTMNKWIGWIITLNFVNIFWVFFRAKSLESALLILKSMLKVNTIREFITSEFFKTTKPFLGNKETFAILVLAIIISITLSNSFEKMSSLKLKKRNILEKNIYIIVSLTLLNRVTEFLYFNF
jgi:alginate O-acetyltransferase complex protein AlgI